MKAKETINKRWPGPKSPKATGNHKELREFFRAKKSKAAHGTVNWAAKRDSWVQAVAKLYNTIETKYLSQSIKDKSVTVCRIPKRISEEYIGVYEVPELIVEAGDEKVVFSPKGAVIAGAIGRIDLRGDMGEVTIVLQAGGRWSIVATRSPTLKLVPLDDESLLIALQSVMRR
jgi:hypothetical protein